MNNYIVLTKILLKNSITEFNRKNKGKASSRLKNILLYVIIALSLSPLIFAVGTMVWNAYGAFAAIGQQSLILGIGFMASSMLVLFFGIFYVMNVFYFSRDVESLLPLPLKPSTIMAAKFTIIMIYEYITELYILAPVLIVYGIASSASIAYYIYALIAFITLPIVPLIYAVILNMLLMRVTNISKHKDKLRIVGGIIAMFIAVFGNMKMQDIITKSMDPQQLINMLTSGNNTMLGILSGIFPTNNFLALSLVNNYDFSGLVNMLIYLGISALCMVLILTLGERMYFKGLLGVSETVSKRKKLTSEQFDKSVVASSAIKSYTLKELKLLFRTPVYFINCVMMNFLWPIFLLIPIYTNLKNGVDIAQLRVFLNGGGYDGIILAVAFAVVMFTSGSNGVTSTSISRDGESFFINKFLPVSYLDQIMGKSLAGILLGIVAMLSMLIVYVVIALPPLYLIALIVLTGLLGIVFTSFAGIIIDLNFPKLHWDNEQKAVKQNMNLLVNMLISMVVAAIVLVPVVMLKLKLWVVFGLLVAVFGILDAVLYYLVKSIGVNLFDKIEV
jgi:ABC-2 type transport system permease protein